MDSVNKTLYIPLYGKALVSRQGILLQDKQAEEIWAAEGFPLKGKARSKWLAYYMSMRAAVFDRWLEDQMEQYPDALILHLGCGMDSRVTRLGTRGHQWFDVDFPQVIAQRQRYYTETAEYHMLSGDIREQNWLDAVPRDAQAIVVMEGISMYLQPAELKMVLRTLAAHFRQVHLLMDCYTSFAARASRYKNPIKDVGVTQVYGLDDPRELEDSLEFVQEHSMTPDDLIRQLRPMEQTVFQTLYAGAAAKKLYRMYEFRNRVLTLT